MRFEILGRLRVASQAGPQFLTAPKREVVLATLLLRANQVVSVEKLVTEVWGQVPPRTATAALHVHVSQLRKYLAESCGLDNRILTCSPGYLIRVGPGELDLDVFQAEVARGRELVRGGRHEEAVAVFHTALAMLREPALNEINGGSIITSFLSWLEEVRLECLELLVESKLALGWHRELVSHLHSLVREDPLHEGFCRLLMLTLYRCDRRAEALQVYQNARAVLRRELGLEPCRALSDLHRAILTADERVSSFCTG
ncbi:AfsR/SARP family transcriptional regulator [Crossiella sp. SN42]|uniref:AfsR/SARP family transcriptional regulator n=1 Tax=Crossiella sp. SN42 TaxID=2944808 RepID=UPI00207C342E|nr:AfsR/SARP family transcriptional regulator [Crossiella sp. SN42]MCO1581923.1 AfsR/SARP family transcriptional regulator [Crossiella sp. SN42]